MPGYTEWTECTFGYLNNNPTILTRDFLNDSPLIATYPERVEEENEGQLCKFQQLEKGRRALFLAWAASRWMHSIQVVASDPRAFFKKSWLPLGLPARAMSDNWADR